MRFKTACNHRDRYISYLKHVYALALDFAIPQRELLERRNGLIRDKAWDKVPRWVQMYVRGYEDALYNRFFLDNIEWVLPYDGKFYKSFLDLPPDGQAKYRTRDVSGKHVYKKDNTKDWY